MPCKPPTVLCTALPTDPSQRPGTERVRNSCYLTRALREHFCWGLAQSRRAGADHHSTATAATSHPPTLLSSHASIDSSTGKPSITPSPFTSPIWPERSDGGWRLTADSCGLKAAAECCHAGHARTSVQTGIEGSRVGCHNQRCQCVLSPFGRQCMACLHLEGCPHTPSPTLQSSTRQPSHPHPGLLTLDAEAELLLLVGDVAGDSPHKCHGQGTGNASDGARFHPVVCRAQKGAEWWGGSQAPLPPQPPWPYLGCRCCLQILQEKRPVSSPALTQPPPRTELLIAVWHPCAIRGGSCLSCGLAYLYVTWGCLYVTPEQLHVTLGQLRTAGAGRNGCCWKLQL